MSFLCLYILTKTSKTSKTDIAITDMQGYNVEPTRLFYLKHRETRRDGQIL